MRGLGHMARIACALNIRVISLYTELEKKATEMPDDRLTSSRKAATFGDQEVIRGEGGETHQVAGGDVPVLTTQQGIPVADDQNSLRIGQRGPTALEDFHFREKIFHFDHERIPERVVHARGFGAHGYFENYESLSDITRADLFQRAGEKTPVFVRFSTVAGNKGSADLARDVRGFAVKLYTKEGNWDLVGNNIPVFFIQDAIKFPDMVHAAKQEPDRGFPQAQTAHDNFWDFISLTPESMHMVMWIMSDRTIPRSFRFMEGFGVHTFRLVNAEGKSTFVKFHWKPKLGMQSVVWNEALKINGADPDFHRRDLWDAIQTGDYPGMGAGPAAVRRGFRREVRLRRARRDQDHPGGAGAGPPRRPAGARPRGRQLLRRDRAGRVLHAEHRARHRLHQRPAAAGPQLLLSRHAAEAARQPQLHLSADQRAEDARSTTSSRTATWPFVNPKGRANYEPNSWGGAAGGPREAPDIGFTSFPAEEQGDEAAHPGGDLRRPLQPGAAVLPEPDAGRADPHRRRLHLRAEQGRDAGDPRPHGVASAECR